MFFSSDNEKREQSGLTERGLDKIVRSVMSAKEEENDFRMRKRVRDIYDSSIGIPKKSSYTDDDSGLEPFVVSDYDKGDHVTQITINNEGEKETYTVDPLVIKRFCEKYNIRQWQESMHSYLLAKKLTNALLSPDGITFHEDGEICGNGVDTFYLDGNYVSLMK
ncbi:MAG: hypothetical protein ACLFPQ_02280 [Candidatus Woesearchaeota archaeon]